MRKVLPMDRVEYLTFSAIDRRYLKNFPIFGFTLEVVIHDPAPWHEPRLSISPERKKKRNRSLLNLGLNLREATPNTRQAISPDQGPRPYSTATSAVFVEGTRKSSRKDAVRETVTHGYIRVHCVRMSGFLGHHPRDSSLEEDRSSWRNLVIGCPRVATQKLPCSRYISFFDGAPGSSLCFVMRFSGCGLAASLVTAWKYSN